MATLKIFLTMPGWQPLEINYTNGALAATVVSNGGTLEDLYFWSKSSGAKVEIKREGIVAGMTVSGLRSRPAPTKIYPIDQVISKLVDNIARITPGNKSSITEYTKKGSYTLVRMEFDLDNTSELFIQLIGDQFKGLPIVLQDMKITVGDKGTGKLSIALLGS